jgi:hypothetical protein
MPHNPVNVQRIELQRIEYMRLPAAFVRRWGERLVAACTNVAGMEMI